MSASENGTPNAITAGQIRAARALLNVTRQHLADLSGVPMRTLSRAEDALCHSRAATLDAIRTALEGAGVEFIAENGGGAGVRLRKGA